MNKRPKIFITNDDGVHAPGIRHLWKALSQMADVIVVAPATEQSAVGLSISLRNPLRVEKVNWSDEKSIWSVNGTPADCVKVGLSVVFQSPPDLIVSGINRGSNAGQNLLYSGTIAGVIEGVMHDIPGIAFSCVDLLDTDYSAATQNIPKIVEYVLANPLPAGTLLNVNFPSGQQFKEIKGLKLARQGKSFIKENLSVRSHPAEGHDYYWLGAKIVEFEEHEESDISWLNQGYATAVPFQVSELTNHKVFNDRKDHFEQFFRND